MQQRFEGRINEYKLQLHNNDEKISSLSDHIRFQKKVIVDQDQKLVNSFLMFYTISSLFTITKLNLKTQSLETLRNIKNYRI